MKIEGYEIIDPEWVDEEKIYRSIYKHDKRTRVPYHELIYFDLSLGYIPYKIFNPLNCSLKEEGYIYKDKHLSKLEYKVQKNLELLNKE